MNGENQTNEIAAYKWILAFIQLKQNYSEIEWNGNPSITIKRPPHGVFI